MKSLLTVAFLFTASLLNADVPALINYQGLLTDINGNVVSGTKTVSISIYDASTNGTQMYSESIGSVTVQNGIYSFQFGSGPTFTTTLATGSQHWLQVTLDGVPQTPRERLVSVPFAMRAGTVPDGSITSAKIASGAVAANLNESGQSAVPSNGLIMSATDNNINLTAQGYLRVGKVVADEIWDQRASSAANSGREGSVAVWTGSELIIIGGYNGAPINGGMRYKPSTNTWNSISMSNAPPVPIWNEGFWTGSEVIVWGGNNAVSGGRYNPATDSWTQMSTVGSPSSRESAMFVWTGSEMLVWGGYDSNLTRLNTGAKYNPSTDSWSMISTVGAPSAPSARSAAACVWTGQEMLIWGGSGPTTLNTGGRYNPDTNTWAAINTVGAPAARQELRAIWTGTEMIVWGAWDYATNFNNGGKYNPVTDTWSAISVAGAPSARREHAIIWTGDEMIVWGGWNGTTLFSDGARYSPATDTWKLLDAANGPTARRRQTAVWTGQDMLIWGGIVSSGYANDSYLYNPRRSLFLYQRP